VARPEQTEKATPKRVREARDRGQVARSPDLGGAVVFLAIIISLNATFETTVNSAAQSFGFALSHARAHHEPTIRSAISLFLTAAMSYVLLIGTAFTAATALAIVVNIMEFGVLFSPNVLKPKFSKLNPLEGFKRIFFSPQTLVQLGKQLLKLSAVALIVYLGIHDRLTMLYDTAKFSPHDLMEQTEGTLFAIALRFGIFLLVLAFADYMWERHRLAESLKMTKTEVKDEHRQQEGNPEMKGALKQRQRAMARRRMMAAIPRATVVVTNPTHFAVALEWDEITMEAPVLTAKGADLLARRIRELAREHNIPILENPPLARTLYDKVELDSPVPPNLYSAVAQVIAFVYRLKQRTIA
jgi:flagellar biosynthesis protein FlhB